VLARVGERKEEEDNECTVLRAEVEVSLVRGCRGCRGCFDIHEDRNRPYE
jgi:hypothetical protein